MKTKGCWLLVCLCLLAISSYAEEPIVAFAKNYVGLDLASVPFGQSVENNGYGHASTPLATQFDLCSDPAVTWVTNALSGKYHLEHANRMLRYAVKNGKVVGIRVSIDPMITEGHMLSQDEIERNRKELLQIYDERIKARKLQKESLKPALFELQSGDMCGGREALVLLELQFTPAGTFLGSGRLGARTIVPATSPASKNSSK